MKTIIIYAHPETPGHCPYILDEVKIGLEAKNHEYEILDLYKMRYDPVLHEEEHYTAGNDNKNISQENKIIQEKIKQAGLLIFIYPVWWGTMPAILTGFFDRVLTPGFAFRFAKFGIPLPLFKGKRAEVFITSSTSRFLHPIFGYYPRPLIKRGLLGFCGIKSRLHHFDRARRLTEKSKLKLKAMIKKALSNY